MSLGDKPNKPVPVQNSEESLQHGNHNAEGAVPTNWDAPFAGGPSNKFRLGPDGERGFNKFFDIDPNLDANAYPRQGGSDSYTGIPGDGIVPG